MGFESRALFIKTLLSLLVCSSLVFCATSGKEGEESKRPGGRKILVLGGNGFIGSETVRRLLDLGDEITIVNRGNWYFDSETRIKPFVKNHFRCDRDKLLTIECEELLTSGNYDTVIDFSSYNARQIQQVVDILRDRIGLYVYISTDSIYEVCDKNHSEPSTEKDAVRPASPKKRLELKRTEQYAHDKLASEEVLEQQRKTGGFPYVALRLPDVIGPRDTSFRFWTYQLWIRLHKVIEHPVHMPAGVADMKFSLIHVEDAAKAIEKVLEVGPAVYNQAINLAFNEHFSLKKILRDMADKLNIDDLNFVSEDDSTWYTYPTVSKGPLDINKAKILLNFEPMAWDTALESLCNFFENAMVDQNLMKEREMLLADFFENIVPEVHYISALHKLLEIYGKDVLKGVDLEVGFDHGAPEIEDTSKSNDASHSKPAPDPKSADEETAAQASHAGSADENESRPGNPSPGHSEQNDNTKHTKNFDEL